MRLNKKIAELEGKIASEQTKITDDTRRFESTRREEDRTRLANQQRADQAQTRRLDAMSRELTEHRRLHRVAQAALDRLQRLPDQITVLMCGTNPMDQEQLRLDEEARAIQEAIRRAEYRDAVRFETRWALRPADLLLALNELRPTVVHFSGHGTDTDEIVFQDDHGDTKLISKEALMQAMSATSGDIQLVFFNTCYYHGQAAAVVAHVPAAIGMTTAIGDEAARVFSTQFYSAIAFGHSVRMAFDQAKALLMLENIPEESTPELFVTEGLNPDQLVLVQAAARLL